MNLDAARRAEESIRSEFAVNQRAYVQRIAGADDERINAAGDAVWSRQGAPMWDGKAVLIARYAPELGVFRWWWTGHTGNPPPSKLDRAFGEAQKLNLDVIQARQIVLDDAADAEALCRLVAHLARAHGLIARSDGGHLLYYALFESAASIERSMSGGASTAAPPQARRSSYPMMAAMNQAYSMPPPPVAATGSRIPAAPAAPEIERPVRQPSLDVVMPLAQASSVAIQRVLGPQFKDAILIVVVDTSREKARFFVQLVAISAYGVLEAPDTTRELLEAVTAMIVADSRAGNGRWKKLVVRFNPTPQGLSVSKVEVS